MKNLFKKSSAISIATAMLASMTLSPLASFAEDYTAGTGAYSIAVHPYYGTKGDPGTGEVWTPAAGNTQDTATRTFTIVKTNSSGTPLDGETEKTLTTDAGTAEFEGLEAGFYKITPVYEGDAASLTGINSFMVQLPMYGTNGGLLETVNVYPKDLFPKDDDDTDLDQPSPDPDDPDDPGSGDIYTSLTLIKTNADGDALNDAEFKLYYKDGNSYHSAGTFKTDGDGDIVLTDLPYGTYYLVETKAPDDTYLLDQTPIEFVISAGDPHVKKTHTNDAELNVSKAYTKVENGKYYWTITADVPTKAQNLVSYTINDVVDTNSIASVEFLTVMQGETELKKDTDYTIEGNSIKFISFANLNKEGEIGKPITILVESTLVDDDNNLANVKNNAEIEYKYAYDPSDDEFPDDIKDPDDVEPEKDTTKDEENPQNEPNVAVQQVNIDVIDAETKKSIEDATAAEFTIMQGDKTIMTGVKDGDTIVLPLGEYKIVQNVAPNENYVLNPDPMTFEVTADTTDITQIEVDFENTAKAGFNLPFTGTISTIIFFAGGICLMAIAGLFIFIIIKKKKEEEEEEQTN